MTDRKIIPLAAANEVLGRQLGKLVGRKRLDAILSKENAPALVRTLPAEDLYFLIKDVGSEDAAPLVAMSSPEQFRGFIDLDCWVNHEGAKELSPIKALRWMTLAREDSTLEDLAAKRTGLDLEVVELILRGGLSIVDRKAVEEDGWAAAAPGEDPQAAWEETPCGSWFVCFEIPGPEEIELRRMLHELYAEGPFPASRLLSAVRYELTSELNEHALRFRNARLADMGFPEPEQAKALYAKTNISATPPPQPTPPDSIPGFFLSEFVGDSFLDRCSAKVTGVRSRTFLDRSLMYLANCVMVADRIEPSDTEAARDAVGAMRAYLNLGLSHLAGNDSDRGSTILCSTALKHVFQVGFTLTLQRKWRAERLVAALVPGSSSDERSLPLDAPEGSVVDALLKPKPMYAVCLDAALAAGWPASPALDAAERAPEATLPSGLRPFAVPEDLEAADTALGRAEATIDLAMASGILQIDDTELGENDESHPLSVLLLTATLNMALGKAFTPSALSEGELQEAWRKARDETGALSANVTSKLVSLLAKAADGPTETAETLASMTAARFELAFPEANGPIDARYTTGVIMRGNSDQG